MRRRAPARRSGAVARLAGLALSALGLGLAGWSGPAAAQVATDAADDPAATRQIATSDGVRGVVELFTAQGCASCPPAERLLSTLADEPGILALAYHVDYWDYIGWRDTYGSHANTARQRAYAKAFRNPMLYTPQAVVNGATEMVGSQEARLRAALAPPASPGREPAGGTFAARFAPEPADRLPAGLRAAPGEAPAPRIVLRRDGDMLRISAFAVGGGSAGPARPLPAARPGREGEAPVLLLVTFDDRVEVPVSEGENAGQTIVNAHAVRDWRVLGVWRGEPMEVSIPLGLLSEKSLGGTGCAALLQATSEGGVPGRILAAAMMEFAGDGGLGDSRGR